MKNNQNGRSMVEMLGVLAIIGVLSAGGLAGYSKAMFKHKLNSTMDQVTMLVTNIRTMYGSQSNYAGLSELKAYKLGIIPEVMVASKEGTAGAETAVTLTNPFKGSVTLGLINATDSTAESGNTGFTVKYDGLPPEACIALSTADFGSGAGSGFIGVEAKGTTGTAAATAKVVGTNEGKALEMSSAINACKGTTAYVTWYFY